MMIGFPKASKYVEDTVYSHAETFHHLHLGRKCVLRSKHQQLNSAWATRPINTHCQADSGLQRVADGDPLLVQVARWLLVMTETGGDGHMLSPWTTRRLTGT